MVMHYAWTPAGIRRLRLWVVVGFVVLMAAILTSAVMRHLSTGNLVGGFIGAPLGAVLLWFVLTPGKPYTLPLDEKVALLRANLESSSQLIQQINAEFALQAAAAEKIKAEAEQNQRLAELNAEQAQAVKTLVESVQAQASKAGGRQQWRFFLAGLLVAILTGVIGNFAFEFVKTWIAAH